MDVVAVTSGPQTGAFDAVGFVDLTGSTVASVSGDPTAASGTFLPGGVVLGLDLQGGGPGVFLQGSFGFLWNASFADATQANGVSSLGTINFDGSGKVTGTYTTETSGNEKDAARTSTGTFTGTYKANSDGTATAVIVPDGGGGTSTVAFVATDSGQGAQMTVLNVDSGLPQTVISGFARATYTGVLKGTYGFQLNNSPRPASTIGWINFDGAGGATVSFLSAGPGDTPPQVSTGNLKGTYTVNKDGTGSVKLAAGGVAAGTFAFVVVDGGSGLILLLTDGTMSNVSSGTARLQ